VSAEWLVGEATGLSRVQLYVNHDRPLSTHERDVLRAWVRRRGEGEPLQLICGTTSFRYLTLKVAPGVLIPRPETEVLVSEALDALKLPKVAAHVVSDEEGTERIAESEAPAIRVLDLCTGSGCIACSIASEYPRASVLATDIAPEALALAQANVELLGLADRVEVRKSDLFADILPESVESFDLVVSNPPYVPSEVCKTLDPEVRDFEPLLALDGGEDGLDLFRSFVDDALRSLKPGGVMALELFEAHLEEAKVLAERAGFEAVRIVADLTGSQRVLVAHKPA
jgi:release factor glutamine methyltransferase